MKICLFSTCVVDSVRLHLLNRMLRSVEAAAVRLSGMHDFHLMILLQNTNEDEFNKLALDIPPFVTIFTMPTKMSLSAARNRLLTEVLRVKGLAADTLFGFPDDDCWYPPGVLEEIIAAFDSDPLLDLWFCRYGSAPKSATESNISGARRASMRNVVRNASSNTIFLRGQVMAAVGCFDESLGVGTPNGGSEDLDVAVAAFVHARTSRYLDETVIGHRDKSNQLRSRYYRSGLIVLARYARRGARREFMRKIAVGLYLCLRGEMAIRELAASYRAVFNIPRRSA